MTNYDDTKYVDDCYTELEQKQAALLKQYKLDSYDSFDYNMTTGRIQYFQGTIVKVEADFIPIGSLNEEDQSWMWAWENPSVTGELREQSLTIKELAPRIGDALFERSTFQSNEGTAWEIAAMACKHFNSQGVFAAPLSGLLIFLSLSNITVVE
ncbi:hypothetical protein MNBD_GAMMA26-1633 [hydrothermal vent metagenome]|uniref:Uncharacterized protein n=1 Tax=hydrothermal vent metagenome TaxID=652676 RepID=A0A3B1B0Z9_9ZZZZ